MTISLYTQYRHVPVPDDWPPDRVTLFSPKDRVHEALKQLIMSANRSIVIAMYGFDDNELTDILIKKITNENIHVMLVLDSTQAGGVHEKKLLNTYRTSAPNSVLKIGRSEKHNIMHLKMGVIDGVLSFTGSTNWSEAGETTQDNELTIDSNPYIAIDRLLRIYEIAAAMTTPL